MTLFPKIKREKRTSEEERKRKEREEHSRAPSSSSSSFLSPPLSFFLLLLSSSSFYSFAFGRAAARMLCVFSATAIDPWILSLRVRNIVCGDAPPTSLAKSASAMTSVTSGLSSGAPLVTFFSFPGRSSRAHLVPSMSKTIRPLCGRGGLIG